MHFRTTNGELAFIILESSESDKIFFCDVKSTEYKIPYGQCDHYISIALSASTFVCSSGDSMQRLKELGFARHQ